MKWYLLLLLYFEDRKLLLSTSKVTYLLYNIITRFIKQLIRQTGYESPGIQVSVFLNPFMTLKLETFSFLKQFNSRNYRYSQMFN